MTDFRYAMKILGLLLLTAAPSDAAPFKERFSCVVLELSPQGKSRRIETLHARAPGHIIPVAISGIRATARWHPEDSLGTVALVLRMPGSSPRQYRLVGRLAPDFPLGVQVRTRTGIFAFDCHITADEAPSNHGEVFLDASTLNCREGRQTHILLFEGGDNNLRATLPAPVARHHDIEALYHPISARLSLGFSEDTPITHVRLIGRATEESPLEVFTSKRHLSCFAR
jgi:hypothetical protein